MPDITEIAAHTWSVVDTIHRSNVPNVEARIHLIHEATGVYVRIERALATAHMRLDQIQDRTSDMR